MIILSGRPIDVILLVTFGMGSACLPLVPGLSLSYWARRQLLKSQREPVESSETAPVSGVQLAEELLKRSGNGDWSIVRAQGPLATFSDATLKQLRLSERVAGGTSPLALGLAAHEFGHMLQDVQFRGFSAIRTVGVFGGKIGCGTAWLIMLSTFMMLNPILCTTAAWLYSASVFALLGLQPLERDANRRCRATLTSMDSENAITSVLRVAMLRSLDATVWTEIANAFPDPFRLWAKRHPPLG